jgi:hypothetical protein
MTRSAFTFYAVERQDGRNLEGRVCGLVEILPGICLEGLRKSPINFSQDSRFPVRDANQGYISTDLGLHEPTQYQELRFDF